jgi:hypothetical protein
MGETDAINDIAMHQKEVSLLAGGKRNSNLDLKAIERANLDAKPFEYKPYDPSGNTDYKPYEPTEYKSFDYGKY